MTNKFFQEDISQKKRKFILIVFSFICWAFLWNLGWHYISKILNFSPESISISLVNLLLQNHEKAKQIILRDFYSPHLLIIVFNIIFVPFVIGFYIGRHSKISKYSNIAITTMFILLYRPFLHFLFNPKEIASFLFLLLMKIYLLFPFFFIVSSLGAFFGSLKHYHGKKSLYLFFYRRIFLHTKRGVLYLLFVCIVFILSIEAIEKRIEELISPFLYFAYAPISFNNDYPLLQVSTSTVNPYSQDWIKKIYLKDENTISLLFYFKNENYIYRAVNTRLSLKQTDKNHFKATVWADNAHPVQDSIDIVHNCNKPQFILIASDWYPYKMKKSQQLPFDQTGREIFNSDGLKFDYIIGTSIGEIRLVTTLGDDMRDTSHIFLETKTERGLST